MLKPLFCYLALFLLTITSVFGANPDPSNTFTIGDGTTLTHKYFRANKGGSNRPFIRWNKDSQAWEKSDDGVSVSGFGGFSLNVQGSPTISGAATLIPADGISMSQSSPNITVDTAHRTASGYIDSCSGTNTIVQTTYAADFPAQTGCTWNEYLNSGIGTITAAATGFGFTFTPTSAGYYRVCSTIAGATSSQDVEFRMVDGSGTEIVATAPSSCVSNFCPFTLCGPYHATSTSPVTFKLQGKSLNSGTVTLRPEQQGWEIERL